MHPLRMKTRARATALMMVSSDSHSADACDGFGPVRQSTVARAPVLTAGVAAGTLVDSTSTRGAAVHNMWPNGSSETNPPDGANKAAVEWAARKKDATAFAGDWVREVSATLNQRVVFGDDPDPAIFVVSAGVGRTAIGLVVPCSPGDAFVLEAQTRATTGGGSGINGTTEINFLDKTKLSLGAGGSITSVALTVGAAWVKTRCPPVVAPAGACYVYLSVHADNANAATATVQFDAITAYRYTETSSDAASAAPALTLAAGGNTFTDIPGTSQSFTPLSDTRKIKVTLCFSGFNQAAAGGVENVRIVFGGTPTQAGSTYNLFWNTTNTHQSWSFMWALAAATLGPVGTAVTVKAQIRSPTGSVSGITMDANDSAAMVIEEIG